MDSNFWEQFFSIVPVVFIGLATGLLSGAFGVGGGIISTPLIRHFLNIQAQIAIGSTLAAIIPTALMGLVNYSKQKKVSWSLSLNCGIPAIFSSIAGSYLCHIANGQLLMLILALIMILVGVDFSFDLGKKFKTHASFSTNNKTEESIEFVERDEAINFSKSRKTIIILGLVTGFISGLLGIGGGFILIPSFSYLFKLGLKESFASSLAVIVIVSIPGTVIHFLHDHVKFWLILPLLVGSIPGAWVGSKLALKTKDNILRKIFGTILIALALLFVWKELNLS